MKKLLLTFSFLFTLAILIFSSQTSCKKETVTNQVTTTDTIYQCPANIKGLWVGTYKIDDQPSVPPQYFSFIIKPDGTLINETKGNTTQYLAQGTWTLTGGSLVCNYTCIYNSAPPSQVGVSQTATATFDGSGNLTSGIWNTPSSSTDNTGTFTVSRVN